VGAHAASVSDSLEEMVTFELGKIDWTAISAISTFLAVLVALFYQPFLNRRKLKLETSIVTNGRTNEHSVGLTVTNLSAGPIWMVSFGFLYKEDDKVVVCFLGESSTPKLLQPSEPIQLCEPSIKLHLNKFDRFFAKDSFGKFWYLNRKQRRKLADQIEKCQRNNPPQPEIKSKLVAKAK
jgi:hypothetical protein